MNRRNLGLELTSRIRALVSLQQQQSLQSTSLGSSNSNSNSNSLNAWTTNNSYHGNTTTTTTSSTIITTSTSSNVPSKPKLKDISSYVSIVHAIQSILKMLESAPIDTMVLKNSNIVETIRQCRSVVKSCDDTIANGMSSLLKQW